MRIARPLVAAGLSWLAAGCRVVGPNYTPPRAAPAAAYAENAPPGWETAQPAAAQPKGEWWRIYQDPQLDALEARVGGNFSLQAAEARYLEARALVRFYHAGALPAVSTDPAILPQRDSANRPLGTGQAATFTSYVLPFDVAWEPDLWGRVAREVEQQSALASAAAADAENVRLSLQAELAVDYFEARTLDAQDALLQRAIAAYAGALRLTEVRHTGGVVSAVDVAQAQTQLATTRAQEQDLGVARAQYAHAIAVLTGTAPEAFQLAVAPLAGAPPATPPGVPSDLLQRRPDIAEAERNVAAANAGIGVAKAAFYPNVTLAAGAGLNSTAIGNLFTLPSTLWSLGGDALDTLYEGGARRATVTAQQQAWQAQVAAYRETTLEAFQEVEDNLAALRVLAGESQTEQAAVSAAQHSLALSNTRYQGGVTTYLEVITAQTTDLADERAAVDLMGERMVASVLLVKALGGGWDRSQLPTP